MKEKVVLGAWAHRDAVWHATLSGIFKTYSVSSTGLDGLISFKYHNFSNINFRGEVVVFVKKRNLKPSFFSSFKILIEPGINLLSLYRTPSRSINIALIFSKFFINIKLYLKYFDSIFFEYKVSKYKEYE